jgi:hypothetical protein
VIKESEQLKKDGLSKFAKKKFKWPNRLLNYLVYCLYMILSKRPDLHALKKTTLCSSILRFC